jgi:hypothetical protein
MAMIILVNLLGGNVGMSKALVLESSFKQTTSKVGPFC